MGDSTPDVSVSALRTHYGEVKAVDGVDLDIATGEFFMMLGPSGSGKTTTLRLIAGFERPDAGAQNTLPILIFGFLRQGQQLPIVNVIALVVIVLTIIPVFVAQRLTSGNESRGRL